MLTPDPDPAARIGRFREWTGTLVLAVSGGGDSTALLHAAIDARRSHERFPAVLALTIDHGLRPGSADDARFVAAICARYDVPHRVYRLDPSPRRTGIQEWARRQRLALFRKAAAETSGMVVTAHTADDDAETLAMRERRGDPAHSTAPGIARALFLRPGWLVRPLLDIRRATLRDWLSDRGERWIDDPSNLDTEFERIAIRRELEADPDLAGALVARAARATGERSSLSALAGAVLRREFTRDTGVMRWQRPSIEQIERPEVLLALRAACGYVGGLEHLPSAEAVRRAASEAIGRSSSRSTARCVLRSERNSLAIRRERRRSAAPVGEPTPGSDVHCPYPHHVPLHDLPIAAALAEIANETSPPLRPPGSDALWRDGAEGR